MDRTSALQLVQQHLQNQNLIKHSLAVEACMRELAGHFGADAEKWGLTGLLHDLDYETTVQTPEQHTLKTVEMLRPFGVGEELLHAIQAHNQRVEPQSRLDHSLVAVDPVTGFIIACALMHPDKKLHSLDLTFMKKRFKEKSFAKGASRVQIQGCEKLGLGLDDFLQLSLRAMQRIAADLGL